MWFIIGVGIGMIISIFLYSMVVAENIASLENDKARLMEDIQRLEYDLHKERYVYTAYRDKDGNTITDIKERGKA